MQRDVRSARGARIFSVNETFASSKFHIYIIAGDFKYDLLKVTENKPADVFADHVQIVIKATYIWITDR